MFESHPDTQYIFPKFRGIDLTALEQSLVIVQHGTRVMGIMDSVVKNLVRRSGTSFSKPYCSVTYKWAQYAIVLYHNRLERLARDMTNLLGPFIIYVENGRL